MISTQANVCVQVLLGRLPVFPITLSEISQAQVDRLRKPSGSVLASTPTL